MESQVNARIRVMLITAMVAALSGVIVNEWVFGSPAAKSVPTGTTPYGTDDGLTVEQSAIATQYLAFPQSYHAILGKLGYPDARDGSADYYRLADGRWAKFNYNAANVAVSVEVQ